MLPVNRYAHLLCIVLLNVYKTLAVPPGFDPDVLPYLSPGYQQLRLGDVCASTSQCPYLTCCVDRGGPHPICRRAATAGKRCSTLHYRNIYHSFCPCLPPARCHPTTRRCV
ncbi:uncharacterized protein LOC119373346 isoform X16 [Rhipicephalus sanguineus]|uniref:uncharacterized protein LOC119373346 isoform X16 n=1 Tax=Rhipicephalus sanguineus TaxID=34632 RepID=UPI0018938CAA|nr:uncharacterized protein LOC119373346 isoform X16 [Rhipicephalus sanguineus]